MAGIFFTIQTYAVKHVVLVGNYYFNPSSLSVTVGDTVRWVWSAGSHTTTSGVIPGGAATWDAPITSSNTSYEYPVTVAGTYNYVCTPHAAMGMVGTFTAVGFVPTLSVSPSNRNVPASSGTTNFTVTSNSAWVASCPSGWCTCTSSGSGNGTINCNYTVNTSVAQRIATITVMVSGLPDQTVTVTQAGAAPTLAVSPANQNVPATSGTVPFNVVSNTSWTSSSNAAWCTVTATGSGNGTINAVFQANPTNSIRTASVTVTVSGLTPQTVTLTQAASTVGVAEQTLNQLQVYPNPTQGFFKLSALNNKEFTAEVTITDMTGKSIFSETLSGSGAYTFNLTHEPKGYYFVRINMAGSSTVRRVALID